MRRARKPKMVRVTGGWKEDGWALTLNIVPPQLCFKLAVSIEPECLQIIVGIN